LNFLGAEYKEMGWGKGEFGKGGAEFDLKRFRNFQGCTVRKGN